MEENNKRIIKNTVFLYIRMFVTMCISFFMTRIVLDKLGASDYGINNVVGGFVAMFTLFNSVLLTGTRRFLALNLGKGNKILLKNTFSTAFIIHLGIAVLIFILLETIGLWFLNTKFNIDSCRLVAANWIFQFSVISVLLNITQTPYIAAVTSHEKFNIYAYLSIFDAISKLIIVFLLVIIPGDKLIIYGGLYLITNIISILLYRIYCIYQFQECKPSIRIDPQIFKEMVQFSSWSIAGNLSVILKSHGFSVLLNLFFGTTINAAKGLADTVTATIQQFVSGFNTAATPQLTKFYGSGEISKFHSLIFNVSQYTLFLLAIFLVPILLEIDYVLKLWLNTPPAYTSIFIKVTLLICLVTYSNYMVDQGVVAIGKMKQLALWTSPVYLSSLPLSYIFLKFGCTPPQAYAVGGIPSFIALIINLYILHKYVSFPAFKFFFQVFLKSTVIILIAAIIPFIVQQQLKEGIERFIIVCSLSVICTTILLYFGGLNRTTRKMIKNHFLKLRKK